MTAQLEQTQRLYNAMQGAEQQRAATQAQQLDAWAEAANERPGSQKLLATSLQAKGYKKDRTKHGRYFKGLRVVSSSWKTTYG